jgi:hypothetical protein
MNDDFKAAQTAAIEVMRRAPTIQTKLNALDGLDRLATNPNGWFGESILNGLTQARLAVITERWAEAIHRLEDARTSIVEFINVLKAKDGSPSEEHKAALGRADDELRQLTLVLAWLDKRPEQ